MIQSTSYNKEGGVENEEKQKKGIRNKEKRNNWIQKEGIQKEEIQKDKNLKGGLTFPDHGLYAKIQHQGNLFVCFFFRS